MIEYKGFVAVLEVDDHADLVCGHTIGMATEINFQGRTVEEAKASFRMTLDAYLSQCSADGRDPGRPFSGKFNVRIPSEVHRGLALAAESRGTSLNEVVKVAMTRFLETEGSREPDTETLRLDDAKGGDARQIRVKPAPGKARKVAEAGV